MENELISIIVPVYNCQEYLDKCINSILNQSYGNFELILINDGSKDKSSEICKKYSSIDDRILYIKQSNRGVSYTRQRGIDISRGEYIAFIDSDDYIKNDYILNLYKNIKKSNSDIICCNSIDFGFINYENNKINSEEIILKKDRLIQDYFKGMRYAYAVWGKLYKKTILAGVKFKEMKYAEDTCMIVELFIKCKNVHLLNYDGYYYRGQENSISNSLNSIQKCSDLITRSWIVYDICRKNAPKSTPEAAMKLINDLYIFRVKYILSENKLEYKEGYQKYCDAYNNIERKYLYKSIKGIVLMVINSNIILVNKFFSIIYNLKNK